MIIQSLQYILLWRYDAILIHHTSSQDEQTYNVNSMADTMYCRCVSRKVW